MTQHLMNKMPDGFFAAPFPEQVGAPLRLCLVISKQDKSERLLPLSVSAVSRAFLGCLVDAADQVREWLAVEFQTQPAESAPPAVDRLTNRALDDLWKSSINVADGNAFIAMGWERRHPPPLALNRRNGSLEYFSIEGCVPHLCTDDAVLAAAGLPVYSGGSARFLVVERTGAGPEFIPTQNAGDSPRSIAELMAAHELLPINPGCHFIRCRSAAPVDLPSLADVFGGAPWTGLKAGRDIVDVGSLTSILSDRDLDPTSSSLFLARHGNWGKAVEGLHLKLKMLYDMAVEVRSTLARTHRPILNLSLDSFSLRVSSPSVGLPFLWTVQVQLIDAGIAMPLNLADGATEIFTPAVRLAGSVYQPQQSPPSATGGHADFRLRRVDAADASRLVAEGTLLSKEIQIPAHAVLSVRLTVSGRELALQGTAVRGTAPTEWSFTGYVEPQSTDVVALLKAAEGTVYNNIWLDIRHNHDAAYDLYALAVCFTRLLLGGSANPLPALIDDLHALAHQLAGIEPAARPGLLVQFITENDRFKTSFGVENAFVDPQLKEAASEMIPLDIWCKLLDLLMRMLPGALPDAFVTGYGGIRGKNQAACFEGLCAALLSLLVQTRSLILIDWRMNWEIHAVIRRVATGI